MHADEFEARHVHVVYDHIAQDFSRTRHTRWPFVERFIDSLEPGSIVLDAGCGNGKYLGCRSAVPFQQPKQLKHSTTNGKQIKLDSSVHAPLLVIGFDMSAGLLEIAAERGHETARGDCFDMSCWRTGSFDHAISIATIHHFATEDRRIQSVAQMIRAVTPSRTRVAKVGQIMIVVWALEQDDSLAGAGSARKAGKKGAAPVSTSRQDSTPSTMSDEQDVFVSWERQTRDYYTRTSKDSHPNDAAQQQLSPDDTGPEERAVFQRYYHLFRKYELAGLVAQAAARCGAVYVQPDDYSSVSAPRRSDDGQHLVVELKEERWERENWVAVVHVRWSA
ncbi:hypothetical protein ACM66B_001756 [Microbotryomycetes sp. NB124-2]